MSRVSGMLRSALRGVFHGRLIVRRLPAAVGGARVHLSPESQLKYLLPGRRGFDRDLLAWAERYVSTGDVVWDIGANSGVFTFAAAGRGASVLAVEPDPFLVHGLLRSRAANPGLQTEVLSAAASDARGEARLAIAVGGRASNSLRAFGSDRRYVGRSGLEVIVPTLRLDDLLALSAPNLVKIDVEGAELAVFRGAARLLAETRPRIIFEVGRELWPEISSLLRRAHYRLVDPLDPLRPADETTWNVMALPE